LESATVVPQDRSFSHDAASAIHAVKLQGVVAVRCNSCEVGQTDLGDLRDSSLAVDYRPLIRECHRGCIGSHQWRHNDSEQKRSSGEDNSFHGQRVYAPGPRNFTASLRQTHGGADCKPEKRTVRGTSPQAKSVNAKNASNEFVKLGRLSRRFGKRRVVGIRCWLGSRPNESAALA